MVSDIPGEEEKETGWVNLLCPLCGCQAFGVKQDIDTECLILTCIPCGGRIELEVY